MQCAMNRMKIGKASGPSGVATELFNASGDKSLKSLTNIFNDTLFKDTLPEEWMLSSLVPIFQGKANPLNPNSYTCVIQSCWNMLNYTTRFWMVVCEKW